MRSCLESITNCRLDEESFCQATLPVKLGGLGIRRTEDICLPAFIASSYKAASIVKHLLCLKDSAPLTALLHGSISIWKAIDNRLFEPAQSTQGVQKSWNLPVAELKLSRLIENANSDITRARLLAVSAPGAGVWLNALPIPSLGLSGGPSKPRARSAATCFAYEYMMKIS